MATAEQLALLDELDEEQRLFEAAESTPLNLKDAQRAVEEKAQADFDKKLDRQVRRITLERTAEELTLRDIANPSGLAPKDVLKGVARLPFAAARGAAAIPTTLLDILAAPRSPEGFLDSSIPVPPDGLALAPNTQPFRTTEEPPPNITGLVAAPIDALEQGLLGAPKPGFERGLSEVTEALAAGGPITGSVRQASKAIIQPQRFGGAARDILRGTEAAVPGLIKDTGFAGKFLANIRANPSLYFTDEVLSAIGEGVGSELGQIFAEGEYDFLSRIAGAVLLPGVRGGGTALVMRGRRRIPGAPGSTVRTNDVAIANLEQLLYETFGDDLPAISQALEEGLAAASSQFGVTRTVPELLANTRWGPEFAKLQADIDPPSRLAARQRREEELGEGSVGARGEKISDPLTLLSQAAAQRGGINPVDDIRAILQATRRDYVNAVLTKMEGALDEVLFLEETIRRAQLDPIANTAELANAAQRRIDKLTRELFNEIFDGHPLGRKGAIAEFGEPMGLNGALERTDIRAREIGAELDLRLLSDLFFLNTQTSSRFLRQKVKSSAGGQTVTRLERLDDVIPDDIWDEMIFDILEPLFEGDVATPIASRAGKVGVPEIETPLDIRKAGAPPTRGKIEWQSLVDAEKELTALSIANEARKVHGTQMSPGSRKFLLDAQDAIRAVFEASIDQPGEVGRLAQLRYGINQAYREAAEKYKDGVGGTWFDHLMNESADGLSLDFWLRTGTQGGLQMDEFLRVFGDQPEVKSAMLAYMMSKARDRGLSLVDEPGSAAHGTAIVDPEKLDSFYRDFGPAIERFPEAQEIFGQSRREVVRTMNNELEAAIVTEKGFNEHVLRQMSDEHGLARTNIFREKLRNLVSRTTASAEDQAAKMSELEEFVDFILARPPDEATRGMQSLREIVFQELAYSVERPDARSMFNFIQKPELLGRVLDEEQALLNIIFKDAPEQIDNLRAYHDLMSELQRTGDIDVGLFQKKHGWERLAINNFRMMLSPIYGIFTRSLRFGLGTAAISATIRKDKMIFLLNEAIFTPEVMQAVLRSGIDSPGRLWARIARGHMVKTYGEQIAPAVQIPEGEGPLSTELLLKTLNSRLPEDLQSPRIGTFQLDRKEEEERPQPRLAPGSLNLQPPS